MLCILLVAPENNKLFTDSSGIVDNHGAAMANDPEVDLTDEAFSRSADPSASPPVTKHSATREHSTCKEGEAPLLFKSFDEELHYLRRIHAGLEK